MLHEFEAMMFVSPESIAAAFSNTALKDKLMAIKAEFDSPEEINDNPQTAPSRRLRTLFPGYQKPLHGPLVVLEIGLDQIRNECPHFNEWLRKLESLGLI